MTLPIKNVVGTNSSISEVDLPLDLAQKTLKHIKSSAVLLRVHTDLLLADAT